MKWLFRHTLASVPFGIIMMILVAGYVSIGSGFPQVREWIEANELMFFALWPFRILMALLVITLVVVTIRRIPLTPPRYGVWMIHLGIILLVITSSAYYSQKTEGLMIVPVGGSSSHYYDAWNRALYARVDFQRGAPQVLNSLPRFHTYSNKHGNVDSLDRRDLRNIQLAVRDLNRSTGERILTPLHNVIGASDPIRFDIVGYWPYANIEHGWNVKDAGGSVGIEIGVEGDEHTEYLVSDDPGHSSLVRDEMEFQHRHLMAQANVDQLIESSRQFHELEIQIGDFSMKRFVQPGEIIEVGSTGYSLTIEGFTPQFPMFGTGAPVDVLSMMVTRASGDPKTFRRMVLNGPDTQTDFLLNVEGAGPMGARQKAPVDNDLKIIYRFSDPEKLMPTKSSMNTLLVTSDDSNAVTRVQIAMSDSVSIERSENGSGEFSVPTAKLSYKRVAHLEHTERVASVEKGERDSGVGQEGTKQVIAVRVRSGEWNRVYYVPFSLWAWDVFMQSTRVEIPGAARSFELALGNQLHDQIPMAVRLDKFEAIPYAGAPIAASS
ncbi:MAG TPA: hypothetical protein PK402_11350, partial [Tepidisphaeraceae bacterium]|nr:hypothetical protein [Tepidisphaeraceae bacterium]